MIHFATSQECLQNPRKSVICSAEILEIPRKFVHDSSKSHEFLGNLGTIQWIHFATSQECLQNPRNSVICSAKILEIPRKFVHNPSKSYKFLGNLGLSNGYALQHHKNAYRSLRKLSFVQPFPPEFLAF